MKGAYIFSFLLKKDCEIIIGKLGKINFKKGGYHYCGSAQNNLEKRIERHKRKEKKIHWHMDYLTTNENFKYLSHQLFESNKKEKECELAKSLSEKCEKIKGFGCTDCKCESHLFYDKEN